MYKNVHIKTVVTVAEKGSLAAASKSLHLSPSAISQRIKQLESRIGIQIFERNNSGMTLSVAGQQLLPLFRQWVKVERSLDEKFRALRHGVEIHLNLGCSVNAKLLGVYSLVDNLTQTFPRLRITLNKQSSVVAANLVASGELHAAIIYGHTARPTVEAEPLGIMPLSVVGPSDWKSSAGDDPEVPWIVPDDDCPFFPAIRQYLGSRFPHVQVVRLASHQESTIKELVENGHGLSLLSAMEADESESRGELAVYAKNVAELPICLAVYRPLVEDQPACQPVIKALAQGLRERLQGQA